jgi:competence protein ComEC
MVPRAVRALGAWHVRTAIVTHPNLDHFNALVEAAPQLGLERVLTTRLLLDRAAARPASAEAFLLEQLRAKGIRVEAVSAGDTLAVGPLTLEFLSPPADASWPADNDHSLVAELRDTSGPARGRALALFTGDIQAPAIEWIRSRRPSLSATVMEAPHHGSAKDAAMRFVDAVAPRVVLQSTGPSRAGDARWEGVRAGRVWWCTATHGAAWVEFGADGSIRSGATREAGGAGR